MEEDIIVNAISELLKRLDTLAGELKTLNKTMEEIRGNEVKVKVSGAIDTHKY